MLRSARSWEEVHEQLGELGLRYARKGSGAVLHVDGSVIKASSIDRDVGLGAMQKRLGPFTPAPNEPALASRRPARRELDPLDPSAEGWSAYRDARKSHQEEKEKALLELRKRHDAERAALRDAHRTKRAEIIDETPNKTLRQAFRSVLAADHAGERAEMRDRMKEERAALLKTYPRFPDYETWLRGRNPEQAERWRHRASEGAQLEGPDAKPSRPIPQDIRSFVASIHGRTVEYHRASTEAATSFTDRGRAIHVHDTTERDAVLASLQLAAQKWGRINIAAGDDRYKALVAQLAAEHGFQIANPELQDEIKRRREERFGGSRRGPRRPEAEPASDPRPPVPRIGTAPPPEARGQLRTAPPEAARQLPRPSEAPAPIGSAPAAARASRRPDEAPGLDQRPPIPRIGMAPPPEARGQLRIMTEALERPAANAAARSSAAADAPSPTRGAAQRRHAPDSERGGDVARNRSFVVTEFDRYHAAVAAERYRVTSIKLAPDGTKDKVLIVDKKDGTSVGFTPDEVRARSRELLRLEARGENLYYTPLSATKHHILVDDMRRERLERFIAAGYKPAVVIESSPGNYQAVITVPKLGSPHDREIANRLTVFLNREYGDPNLSGAVHPHRAPGFSNRKPQHEQENGAFPVVKLVRAEARECDVALQASKNLLDLRAQEAARVRERPTARTPATAAGGTAAATAYYEHHRDISDRVAAGSVDYSRIDAMIALRLRATGHDQAEIAAALEKCAPTIRPPERQSSHEWADYAQRTAAYAFGAGGNQQLERTRRYHEQWRELESAPVRPHPDAPRTRRNGPEAPDI